MQIHFHAIDTRVACFVSVDQQLSDTVAMNQALFSGFFFFYLPRRVFLLRRLPSPKPQMSEPVEEKRNLQYCLHMVDLRFFIPPFHSPWNASLTDQLKPQEPIQITMLN